MRVLYLFCCSVMLHFAGAMDLTAFAEEAPAPYLLSSNTEAPFCFRRDGQRRWPICSRRIDDALQIELVASRNGVPLKRGRTIELDDVQVDLQISGWLHVTAGKNPTDPFQVEVRLLRDGVSLESQSLELRAAPPLRPISYYADFGDEIIRIFMEPSGQFRPLTKGGLDQYFRRLQGHGTSRLIVWQSPFPFMIDHQNYLPDEWQNYAAQSEAIRNSQLLDGAIKSQSSLASWGWIRELMSLRANPAFGDMLTQAALDHEIALTASFRPFEAALTKYYYVPTFDENGKFLWNFLPMASPAINYHPDQVANAHYRQILASSRYSNHGRLTSLRLKSRSNVEEFVQRWQSKRDNLRIMAAPFPPLQANSFVLQRERDGRFQLRPYAEIRAATESHFSILSDWRVVRDSPDTIRIQNLRVPLDTRYLWISNPSGAAPLQLDSVTPVELYSAAGNRLGRENSYWVAGEQLTDAGAGQSAPANKSPQNEQDKAAVPEPSTRVGGITSSAEFYTEFQATETSIQRFSKNPTAALAKDLLVISLGELFSSEMLDFNLPRSRAIAIAEMKTILAKRPFDEVFINTRTHTQLAGNWADGDLGLAPIAEYNSKGGLRAWLGMDLAYAPRSIGRALKLQSAKIETREFEKLTTWQSGEWLGTCQSAQTPFVWRWQRNVETAAGIHRLLSEMESAFPENRIRVVLPERAAVTQRMQTALNEMKKEDGSPYGKDYLRSIVGSLNYHPPVCEAMALLDLAGLRVEPTLLGVRYIPAREPFKRFVHEALVDLQSNRGSSFRGPRSFFYEAQETLRASDQAMARREREHHICHLLSLTKEIQEVILYEAADWAYFLSIADGHRFLDNCFSEN